MVKVLTERVDQFTGTSIENCEFFNISSNVNGGCFSVANLDSLSVCACLFALCSTTATGGCFYAREIVNGVVIQRNCYVNCCSSYFTNTHLIESSQTFSRFNAYYLCSSSRIGAYGSYYIRYGSIDEENINCSSSKTNNHGPGGYVLIVTKQNQGSYLLLIV